MSRRAVIAIVGIGADHQPAMPNAHALGKLIAAEGWVLITGGRNAGVMRAANDGAKDVEDSLTIGILPDSNTEVALGVDVAIFTGTGEARNNIIVLSSDVVIACGVDDAGTASEVALAMKNGKPVILLAASEEASKFFRTIGGDNIHFADTPEDAVLLARKFLPKPTTT